MSTTVFVSGGNRGIGLGLVQKYAARENYTVVATARDPSRMPDVKGGAGSKVVVIKMDQAKKGGCVEAIEEAKSKGITQFDIVICSAATLLVEGYAPLRNVPLDVFEEHWRVNVLGFLAVFQATVPLIRKGGKFIFISSGSATIDQVPRGYEVTYGISKSGASYLGHFAHYEEPDLIVFPLDPGWTQTDMGNASAKNAGVDAPPLTIDESTSGMIKVIDEATRKTHGGKQMRYDGGQNKW
ncbi:hypothetical protein I204_04935 [Kwoniella mangroviensis CBS 8886]|uniref:uncharacterized protein n=1 Tax=Kwoniella mangroviensis CBS 8507 TaxID=1296122 RepID=UPI00080D4F67|nr:uncharacterized protein I203_06349 [Kwoniella mangroviensis CBS 8507]OCF64615.1 hypothetical protein I203_06349 [Kwoniella mangroviensis CBS 8507]OCF74557.1 hypothetical protein I204_04935 [Kwoniella mangroviensis CBS 8886]